jgi:hypothetical protein
MDENKKERPWTGKRCQAYSVAGPPKLCDAPFGEDGLCKGEGKHTWQQGNGYCGYCGQDHEGACAP